ncbi:hypothetical protein GCM10023319_32130 [Nocardia iowensis]
MIEHDPGQMPGNIGGGNRHRGIGDCGNQIDGRTKLNKYAHDRHPAVLLGKIRVGHARWGRGRRGGPARGRENRKLPAISPTTVSRITVRPRIQAAGASKQTHRTTMGWCAWFLGGSRLQVYSRTSAPDPVVSQ